MTAEATKEVTRLITGIKTRHWGMISLGAIGTAYAIVNGNDTTLQAIIATIITMLGIDKAVNLRSKQ